MNKLDLNLFWPHRYWLMLLVFSLILMFGSRPLLHSAEQSAQQNLQHILAEQQQNEQALRQLRDDVAMAKNLKTQMSLADAEKSLAPVDRLLAANQLERAASIDHIKDFTYNLAPEEKIKLTDATAEAQEVSVSTITLHGEAPSDTDAYHLISRLQNALPGRLRLKQFSVERMAKTPTPVATYNVRFDASLEWLSNGTDQSVVGGI